MSDTSGQGPQGTAADAGTEPVQPPVALPESVTSTVTGGQPQQQPQPPQTAPLGGQGGDQSGYSDLASGFLQGVPPEQRAALEPFVKQWDGEVTRRFQQVHSAHEPWRQFEENGIDPASIDQALSVMSLLETDPQALLNLLQEQVGGAGPQQPGTQGVPDPSDWGDLPPALQSYLQTQGQEMGQLRSLVQVMGNAMVEQQTGSQQQQEDAALDAYMGDLKTRLGDFDEDYVLTKMASGVDGEKAVRAYQGLIQGGVNGRFTPGGAAGPGFNQQGQAGAPAAATPPVLSGGSTPSAVRPITDASPSEVKSLVTQLLQDANKT